MTTESSTTVAATPTEGQTATSAASPATEAQVVTGGEQTAQPQQTSEGQTLLGGEESQTQGDKTEGEQGTDGDKPAGAPEKYEFKAPEGESFDPEVIAAYSEVAKELNLPQEAAQKVIDKIAPVMQAKTQRVLDEAQKAWGEASRSDKEFGGEKFDENMATMQAGFKQLETPELRELLKVSGLQHHPEILRVFYRYGKAISQDGFVSGGAGKGQSQSVAQRMYPNMNP